MMTAYAIAGTRGELLLLDGAHRAGAGAGTAGDAGIRVDDIAGIALGDGANRAALRAGAAGNAGIGDLVSHRDDLLIWCWLYCSTRAKKIKRDFWENVE